MEAPKEKAKELSIKFTDNTDVVKPNIRSKEMALICVDEINNALQNIPDLQVSGNVLLDQIKYYQEVKQEITNL